jgi:hypothetical protein
MGVTLHYKTVQPVHEGVRQQILEETKRLDQERNWWTEPIDIYYFLTVACDWS